MVKRVIASNLDCNQRKNKKQTCTCTPIHIHIPFAAICSSAFRSPSFFSLRPFSLRPFFVLFRFGHFLSFIALAMASDGDGVNAAGLLLTGPTVAAEPVATETPPEIPTWVDRITGVISDEYPSPCVETAQTTVLTQTAAIALRLATAKAGSVPPPPQWVADPPSSSEQHSFLDLVTPYYHIAVLMQYRVRVSPCNMYT